MSASNPLAPAPLASQCQVGLPSSTSSSPERDQKEQKKPDTRKRRYVQLYFPYWQEKYRPDIVGAKEAP